MYRPLASLSLLPLALALQSVFAADVDPALRAGAADGARVDALIVFADQSRPALAPLDARAGYRERRRALVDALRGRAQVQQAGVRAWLDEHGLAYRPYWIANLIAVRLDADELGAVARRDDVARVVANPKIAARLPQPLQGPGPAAPRAIEWNVSKIGAPLAWEAGYRGQGVVIGGEDTGYQWDHPALKPQYRGWADGVAEHAYNWHDAVHDSSGNPCGNDAPAPCDDHGHGTHTAGTFAGDDGGDHRIGVAPGARWIGCRNMDGGVGTPASYIECMQWMLAPTDAAGQNEDPDRAPDIVSNSWTCTPDEGCTTGTEIATAVDNLAAGGIFFVAGAANEGPACGSIAQPPAIYEASFVVGMTDAADALDFQSSRGPVSGVERVRPDVVAPGVAIVSSVPNDDYAVMTGTSMATPNVAGAAALLMSADPTLKGDPQRVAALLRDTAIRDGVSDPYNSGCGGLTMADWPNYQAGYGRIDVWAAVQAALAGDDGIFADGFDE